MELVKKERISLFCIDEAHAVQQNGRDFRPEFVEATNKMKHFIDASPTFILVIAMSATLCEIDRDTLCDLLGVDVPTITHGPLNGCDINFQLIMSGNPAPTM